MSGKQPQTEEVGEGLKEDQQGGSGGETLVAPCPRASGHNLRPYFNTWGKEEQGESSSQKNMAEISPACQQPEHNSGKEMNESPHFIYSWLVAQAEKSDGLISP